MVKGGIFPKWQLCSLYSNYLFQNKMENGKEKHLPLVD
jgi:hypothetical protein